MKKLYYFLIIALVAGFVSACSLEAPASGHLAITVPYSFSASAAKGLSTRDITFSSGTNPYIRIYVLLNGTFVNSTSSANYVEQSLAASATSTSYSVDLPASTGYKAYAVLGTKDSSGLWTPVYYGQTDTFAVSSGVYTAQTVTVAGIPYAYSYPSSSASSAIYDGSNLYIVQSGAIYKVAGDGSTSKVTASISGTINSLSLGRWSSGPEVWANTTAGIWSVTANTSRYNNISPTRSGAVTGSFDGSSSNTDLLIYYYGSDIGAAYSSAPSGTADTWSNSGSLSSYLNGNGSSLKTLISDPSTFFKAGAFINTGTAATSYGVAATSVGTYLINSSMQSSLSSNAANWLKSQITSGSGYAFSAPGASAVQFTALAFDSTSSPKYLYAGSDKGLYQTAPEADFTKDSAPALTTLVSGISVKALTAYTFNSSSYAAYVDGSGQLVILKNGATSVSYPFYSYTASSSGIKDLSFYVSDSYLYLAIASSDGVELLQVALS
jgi:hypothetical protein